jgi:aminoglycoside 6'-N-acetyltransferase
MISFRPLRREDFALLGTWLAEPLVARWWNHDHRPEAVERDFGPAVDGREPAEMFIVTADSRPFGLIQRYRIGDYPEYLDELSAVWPVPEGSISIDYLVGEPELRRRGLGSLMIARFVELSRGAADVVVPVVVANRASWRALEQAGFRRVAAGELTPDNPLDGREHYVYHRARSPDPAGA